MPRGDCEQLKRVEGSIVVLCGQWGPLAQGDVILNEPEPLDHTRQWADGVKSHSQQVVTQMALGLLEPTWKQLTTLIVGLLPAAALLEMRHEVQAPVLQVLAQLVPGLQAAELAFLAESSEPLCRGYTDIVIQGENLNNLIILVTGHVTIHDKAGRSVLLEAPQLLCGESVAVSNERISQFTISLRDPAQLWLVPRPDTFSDLDLWPHLKAAAEVMSSFECLELCG